MPFRVGPWEIGLILVIILIVFGVGKLPQVGEAMGKSMRAFRRGQSDDDDTKDTVKAKTTPKKTARKSTAKS